MQPQPRDIEYYLEKKQREVRHAGRHVRWENVELVHRKVIRYENGRPLVVSDVVVSEDPEAWKANNPTLELKGDVHRDRQQRLSDVQRFIQDATDEELAELGIDVPVTPSAEEVASAEDTQDPEAPDEYPADLGGGWWVASDGEKIRGEANARAYEHALSNEE